LRRKLRDKKSGTEDQYKAPAVSYLEKIVLVLLVFVVLFVGSPLFRSSVKRAAAGLEPATVCPRTGQLLPPRSRHVRRTGEIVLGFDHFCFWLGTPIGIHNRKYFVLFVVYSAIFCLMGSAYSLYELMHALPGRLGMPAFPWFNVRPLPRPRDAETWSALAFDQLVWLVGGVHGRIGWFVQLFQRSATPDGPGLLYTAALFWSAALNPVAAALLSGFSAFQLFIVLKNRTSLKVGDSRYDVGCLQNWCQVFGDRAILWPLPLGVSGTRGRKSSLGYAWPVNPSAPIGVLRRERYTRPA